MKFREGKTYEAREVTLQEAYDALVNGTQVIVEDREGVQVLKERPFGLITFEQAVHGRFFVLEEW